MQIVRNERSSSCWWGNGEADTVATAVDRKVAERLLTYLLACLFEKKDDAGTDRTGDYLLSDWLIG